MSKLEEKYLQVLKKIDKDIIYKKRIFFNDGTSYESDFYLPNFKVYVELKGIMTLENMTKLFLLSKKIKRFYILQATEKDWHKTIEEQLRDIKTKKNLSAISREGLINFIRLKFKIFKDKTGLDLMELLVFKKIV